jgi:aminoglycoside 6'-N-acetyltransferase I
VGRQERRGDVIIDIASQRIVDQRPDDEEAVLQTAAILVEGFKEHWPRAWPDIPSALAEVRESFGTGRISRVAVDRGGNVLGWIGGISQYRGNVWELHPLVVRPDVQNQGIGRALVKDLVQRVREVGGLVIWAGTDDEDGMTTLSGVDLFPDVLGRLRGIKNVRGHPYEFYQKLGFVLTGVMPDANGRGKPDIFMAMPVSR